MYFNQKSILAADYLRLSRDDGDKMESDSIRNQRSLITEFVKQHSEITLVEEYADDGYSGTNFERPAFQRMIEDVKRKKINCIIVKDLSRLGRNYIETGKYLEKIFPLLGVRFIAVTDHYDSADESNDSDQLIVPFKNLINDAYCRDISIKIRSQLDVKRKNGQFIGSFAGYGYMKEPLNKNHLIIDEQAAEIVRLIFKLKLDGYSSQRIADHLNSLGVLTPMEYKRKSGFNFNSGFRSGNSPKWAANTVNRILKNELYVGMVVQGKNQKINYKVKQSRVVDEKDWIRVDKMHDAIIPQEVFQSVQELLLLDTRTAPNEKSVYLFSGILRCGDCEQNMVRRTATKNGKKYYYYHCSTYKNGDGCSSHIISEISLKSIVLKAIRNQISLLDDLETFVERMEQEQGQSVGSKVLDKQIQSLKAGAEKYRDLKVKLYQDMQEGIVTRDEYQEMSQRFNQKIMEEEAKCREVERKREQVLTHNSEPYGIVKEFQKYRNIITLERKTVITLIEQIVVYGKDKVEIHFNHEDEILELLELAMEQSDEDERKGALL